MKSMSVGSKLGLSVGALALLLGVSSWVGLRAVGSLGSQLEAAVNVTAKQIDLKQAVGKRIQEAQADSRGMLIGYLRNNPDRVARNQKTMSAAVARIHEQVAELRALAENEQDRRDADQIESIANDWTEAQKALAAAGAAKEFERADELLDGTLRSKANQLEELVAKAVKGERDDLARESKAAVESIEGARWTAFGLIVLAVVICISVSVVIRQVHHGLRRAVLELSQGARQVAIASAQVASSSQGLAQGASEQAASIEETSASSEEINSMARKNSENSSAVADLMNRAEQRFTEANQALEQTVVAMGEINTHSANISKIIKAIDEIAFQTNILALNAAVEAARAGEAGMGFAVVADEVRNLSQRCAKAAQDTSTLIEESVAKSQTGAVKVNQVATAIHAITSEIAKVKTLVDEVSLGSTEQARGIDHIGRAIMQMEQVTQGTAANAEESAAAAEELSAESEALKGIVERLSAMVGGAGAPENAPRMPEVQKKAAERAPVRRPAVAGLRPDRSAFPLESTL